MSWISVKDELPPMHIQVLIHAYGFTAVAARQCENEWETHCSDWLWYINPHHQKRKTTVTHWMHLPDAPTT